MQGDVHRTGGVWAAWRRYLGHMWELYAMWTFVAVFFFDFFSLRGYSEEAALRGSGMVGFAVIGVGALGCVVAGVWADRLGRERVTIWAMAVSGACAPGIGWMLGWPLAFGVLALGPAAGILAMRRLRSLRVGSE